MLTIKTVEGTHAAPFETIYEAKRAWCEPIDGAETSATRKVLWLTPEDTIMSTTTENANIYVMNDKGRTIATY